MKPRKPKPMVWTGDLDDDCSLRWRGMSAHAECMGDGVYAPIGERGGEFAIQTWYAAVNRGKTQLFHSGDAGGSFSTGELARVVCEAIMRGYAR